LAKGHNFRSFLKLRYFLASPPIKPGGFLTKIPPFIKNQAVNLQNKRIHMPQRFFYLVVVLIFTFDGESFGQLTYGEKPLKLLNNQESHRPNWQTNNNRLWFLNANKKTFQHSLFAYGQLSDNVMPVTQIPVLQKRYEMQNMSFFCRKEWQFEKATSIPLRIRMGSLEYTNYLEQKPNSLKPN